MRHSSHASLRTHLRRLRLAAAGAVLLSALLAGTGGSAIRAASGGVAPVLGASFFIRGLGVVETLGIIIVGALIGLAILQLVSTARAR